MGPVFTYCVADKGGNKAIPLCKNYTERNTNVNFFLLHLMNTKKQRNMHWKSNVP